jgi:hypothetical protein
MSRLEIGYIAGHWSHSSSQMNRKLSDVRSAVDAAASPYTLVPVIGETVRPERPLVIDLTASSSQLRMLLFRLRQTITRPPILAMHMSGFCDWDDEVMGAMKPKPYRGPVYVRHMVKEFVASLPEPFIGPIYHRTALTKTILPEMP